MQSRVEPRENPGSFFMPENERTVLFVAEKVDAITLEIEATTQKADKGIDKTI